jgi:ABC-type phosphate transport system substrate-binding protein
MFPCHHVSLLNCPSGSGTLAALIKYVLDGKQPQSAQLENVPDSTQDVVNQVVATPGAIGYVTLDATTANASISILEIDGQAPGIASIFSGPASFASPFTNVVMSVYHSSYSPMRALFEWEQLTFLPLIYLQLQQLQEKLLMTCPGPV